MNDTKVFNSAAQGILAKLLATENITVHVGDYRTAFFDTKNRILGLPTWNVKSKHLSDLLVGHEVGHALWTEQAHIDQFRTESPHIPFDIYNIVEDVRIERMIQNRYPGLISSFTTGYDELHRDDFFGISKADLNELGFADRLNLKAKLGHRIDVPMNDAELAIFKRCTEAETFTDVYQIVKDIYEMVKAKKSKPNKIPKDVPDALRKNKADKTPDPSAGSNDSSEEGDEEAEVKLKPEKQPKEKKPTAESDKSEDEKQSAEDNGSSDGAEDDDSKDETASKKGDSGSSDESDSEDTGDEESESDDSAEIGGDGSGDNEEYDDPEKELSSPTLERLQENLSALQADYGKVTPIIMPTKDQLDAMVTPWQDVVKGRIAHPSYNRMFAMNTEVHADWVAYKKKTKKQIQPLINEFERRKAAFQYSRSKVSESGEIDVNRLHSYRFNDEIFRSVTKLADAKNHGMVFLIDYSSSMSYDIFNILDQTLNIVMFCQAVGIPFQVFGFSSFGRGGYQPGKHPNDFTNRKYFRSWDFLKHQIDMCVANVFELLSSDMKKEEQELGMRHLRAAIYYHENRYHNQTDYTSGIPFRSPWEKMDTTPLQEALIILHRIVEKFKTRYRVQRMNVLVLTDGGPDPMYRGSDSSLEKHIKTTTDGRWSNGGIQLSTKFYGRDLILKEGNSSLDRIAGIHNYAALIENLSLSLDCTLIGFFISRSRTALKRSGIASVMESASYPKATNWNTASDILDKELRSYSKNKCMFINGGFNYDCYFLVDSHYAAVDDSEEFESSIDDEEFSGETIKGSAKNKLAREFTKFNSDKRTSRLVLAKFAEMVS